MSDQPITINITGDPDPDAIIKALRDHFAKQRHTATTSGVLHCPGCTCNKKDGEGRRDVP